MLLERKNTGELLEAIIELLAKSDYTKVDKSSEFEFNWRLEHVHDIYKIYLIDEDDKILGLMSLTDIPREQRIHLNLIEVSRTNRGKHKALENIAGCLIAFACRLAFKRTYDGFVSLEAKTQLIALYQDRYGFRQYGNFLAIDQDDAKALINKYLSDEK